MRYACSNGTRRGFFEAVCAPSNATARFRDPPRLTIRELREPVSPYPQHVDHHDNAHRKPDNASSKRRS
jgi:hypothetical protein